MPPRNVGTLSLADLLERTNTSPIEFGLDNIAAAIQRDLDIHNRLTTDMVSTYAQVTTDVRRRYGVGTTIRMVEADEFTRAHTQKAVTGAVVEFPLRKFQLSVGWTADFFRRKTVADMAITQKAAQAGHQLEIRLQMQKALYLSSNYTFTDYDATGLDLNVKRFLNADSAPIPNGPNGETFTASTHTHYLGSATLTNAAVVSLVATVIEHHQDGQIKLFINAADETAFRALTDFKAYIDQRLTLADTANNPTTRLNPFRTNDRAIGLFGAAEVWVKPWAIANYIVALETAGGAKPLAIRVPDGNTIRLEVAGTNVMFPLQAEYQESHFGVGVSERTAGAVLYFANATYSDPTISVASA